MGFVRRLPRTRDIAARATYRVACRWTSPSADRSRAVVHCGAALPDDWPQESSHGLVEAR